MAAIEEPVAAAHGKYAKLKVRNGEWGACVTTPCRAGDWVVIWKGGVHPAWERVREVVWTNRADCWMVALQARDARGAEPATPAGSVPRPAPAEQPAGAGPSAKYTAPWSRSRSRRRVTAPAPVAAKPVETVACLTCGGPMPKYPAGDSCSECFRAAAQRREAEYQSQRVKRDEEERAARRALLQRSLGEAFDAAVSEADRRRAALESVFDGLLAGAEAGRSALVGATDNWRGIDASELWGNRVGAWPAQVDYLGVTYYRGGPKYGAGPDAELELYEYRSRDGKVLCVYND